MSRIQIYTTRWCGYCVRAKALLDDKGIPYEEIIARRRPGLPPARSQELTGGWTVPQILIDGTADRRLHRALAARQVGAARRPARRLESPARTTRSFSRTARSAAPFLTAFAAVAGLGAVDGGYFPGDWGLATLGFTLVAATSCSSPTCLAPGQARARVRRRPRRAGALGAHSPPPGRPARRRRCWRRSAACSTSRPPPRRSCCCRSGRRPRRSSAGSSPAPSRSRSTRSAPGSSPAMSAARTTRRAATSWRSRSATGTRSGCWPRSRSCSPAASPRTAATRDPGAGGGEPRRPAADALLHVLPRRARGARRRCGRPGRRSTRAARGCSRRASSSERRRSGRVFLASRYHALTTAGDSLTTAQREGRELRLDPRRARLWSRRRSPSALHLAERRLRFSARAGRLLVAGVALAAVLVARRRARRRREGRSTWSSDAIGRLPRITGAWRRRSQRRLLSASGNGRSDYWRVAGRWSATSRCSAPAPGASRRTGSGSGRSPSTPATRTTSTSRRSPSSGRSGWPCSLATLALPLLALPGARRLRLRTRRGGAYAAYLVHAGVDWDWEVPAVTVPAIFCAAVLLAVEPAGGSRRC